MAQKSLFLELAGSGGIASVNYEKPVSWKSPFRMKGETVTLPFHLRFGFSLVPIDKNNGTVLIFPVMAHKRWGTSTHKIDIGLGQAFSITTRGSFFVRMPLSVGYHFQPSAPGGGAPGRLFYRIAYTPIVSYLLDFQWEHWAGIAIGINLNPKSR